MSVNRSSLKLNHLYYRIGIVDDPEIGVEVSTWVFMKQVDHKYYFLEWNAYKWKKIGAPSADTMVDFGANVDPETGDFIGFVEVSELVDEIRIALPEEDDIGDEE